MKKYQNPLSKNKIAFEVNKYIVHRLWQNIAKTEYSSFLHFSKKKNHKNLVG